MSYQFEFSGWRARHNGRFQVRTAKGRLLGTFEHIEQAEHCALMGRSRDIWKWLEGRYTHKGTYS